MAVRVETRAESGLLSGCFWARALSKKAATEQGMKRAGLHDKAKLLMRKRRGLQIGGPGRGMAEKDEGAGEKFLQFLFPAHRRGLDEFSK